MEDYNVDLYESDEDIEIENENIEIIENEDMKKGNIEDINKVDKDILKYVNYDMLLKSENINTSRYITLYEKTGIIGQRADELEDEYEKKQFMPHVLITKDMINKFNELDFIKIAEKEFEERKIPYYIKRHLPNNKYVIIDINELKIKDIY